MSESSKERISTRAFGDRHVGTYTHPNGRVAIVTHERSTPEEARRAAEAWVDDPEGRDSDKPHSWQLHPEHVGYYDVVWDSRLGPRSTLK